MGSLEGHVQLRLICIDILILLFLRNFFAAGWKMGIAATSFIFIGALLNTIVVFKNHGKMPSRLGRLSNRVSIDENTRYAFLGDVIPLHTKSHLRYGSLGDVLMVSGAIALVIGFLFLL